jgi:predicted nucleic acid-binding protein
VLVVVGAGTQDRPHKRAILRTLDLYSTYDFLDFEDCLSIAHMEQLGIAEILSHDMGFDKVAEVTRTEPASQRP